MATAQITNYESLQRAFYESPRVQDYYAAWDDYYTSTNAGDTLRQGQPEYPTEAGVIFLSAWMYTGEDRYLQAAEQQLDFAHSEANSSGLLDTSSGYGRDPQARQIYNFYTAYKLTGQSQYLQWADQAATGMLASIPRALAQMPNGAGSTTVFDAGFSSTGFYSFFDANQNAEVGLAYSLLYNDPNSVWHNRSQARTIATNEINGAQSLQNPTTGALALSQNRLDQYDTGYGGYAEFTLRWANTIWNNSTWAQKNNAGAQWLATFSSGTGQVADRYYPAQTDGLSSWDLWYRIPSLSAIQFPQPNALIDRYVTQYESQNDVINRGYQVFGYYPMLNVAPSYYLGNAVVKSTVFNFESSTYHTGSIANQNGWYTSGSLNSADIVTPALSGGQSLYMQGDGYARHSLVGITIDNGTSIEWLEKITGGDWSTVGLNNSNAGGTTYLQIEFHSDGDIFALTNTGTVTIGHYAAGDVYKVTVTLDYTDNRYGVFLRDMTTSAQQVFAGYFNFAAPTTFGEAASGEILLRMRSGGLFDDLKIIPATEPSTLVLMMIVVPAGTLRFRSQRRRMSTA